MNKLLFLASTIFFLVSCDTIPNIFNSSNDNNDKSKIEQSDPFEIIAFNTNAAELAITVSYSGGCKKHRFVAHWDGEISQDGTGNQLFSITILHDNNRDKCEAVIQKVLQYNLTELLEGNFQTGDMVELINGSK